MHTVQKRTADGLGSSVFACAAALVLLSSAACGAEGVDGESFVVAQVSGASLDAGTPLPAYTATVSAAGSGCPENTVHARVSEQGAVEVSFDDFEATVGAGAPETIKDCQIVIKLSAATGASYQVASYAHYGHAMLQQGVEGKQSSSFYFPNARGGGRLRNSIVLGPRNEPIVSEPLTDSAADHMWTPCALENQLQITTRLTLKSTVADANGILSFGAADPAHTGVALTLAVRPCTLPTPPPPR